MKNLKDILKNKKVGSKYVNHEFQVYGHWLATQLDATDKQISMFIKLAKEEDRDMLEECLSFVKGVNNPKNKVGLFLWKMKKLKEEREEREEEKENTELSDK